MNATIGSKNAWQSIHSDRLYFSAKEAGERYQQALAARAAELGYAIVPSHNGTFELDGVPREVTLAVQQPGQGRRGTAWPSRA